MNYKNFENVSIKTGVSLMEHQKIISSEHVGNTRSLWWLLNLLCIDLYVAIYYRV